MSASDDVTERWLRYRMHVFLSLRCLASGRESLHRPPVLVLSASWDSCRGSGMPDDQRGLLLSATASASTTTSALHGIMRLDLGTIPQRLGSNFWQLQQWNSGRLRVRPAKLSGRGLQHASQH